MAKLTEAEVLAGLMPIFQEVLDIDVDNGAITAQTSAADIHNWDSLAHMEIIEMVQRKYKVKFSLAELQKLKTVGDMADLIVLKTSG